MTHEQSSVCNSSAESTSYPTSYWVPLFGYRPASAALSPAEQMKLDDAKQQHREALRLLGL